MPSHAIRDAVRGLMTEDEMMVSYLSTRNAEKDPGYKVITSKTIDDIRG